MTGWQLTEATDISADGRTIVGIGKNPGFQDEGWVAVIADPPPEHVPSIGPAGLSALALIIGAAGLAVVKPARTAGAACRAGRSA